MFDQDKTLVNMLVKFTEPMTVIIERCATAVLLANKSTIFNPVFSIQLNGMSDLLHAKEVTLSGNVYTINGIIHLRFGDFIISASPSNDEKLVVGQFID